MENDDVATASVSSTRLAQRIDVFRILPLAIPELVQSAGGVLFRRDPIASAAEQSYATHGLSSSGSHNQMHVQDN